MITAGETRILSLPFTAEDGLVQWGVVSYVMSYILVANWVFLQARALSTKLSATSSLSQSIPILMFLFQTQKPSFPSPSLRSSTLIISLVVSCPGIGFPRQQILVKLYQIAFFVSVLNRMGCMAEDSRF
jgi:hypothetical protein